jgi:hypothetical protein
VILQAGYHPESPATLFFGVTVGDVAYWADSLLMAGLLRFAARPFQRLMGAPSASPQSLPGDQDSLEAMPSAEGLDGPLDGVPLGSTSRVLAGDPPTQPGILKGTPSPPDYFDGGTLVGEPERTRSMSQGMVREGSNEMGYLFQVCLYLPLTHSPSSLKLDFLSGLFYVKVPRKGS